MGKEVVILKRVVSVGLIEKLRLKQRVEVNERVVLTCDL